MGNWMTSRAVRIGRKCRAVQIPAGAVDSLSSRLEPFPAERPVRSQICSCDFLNFDVSCGKQSVVLHSASLQKMHARTQLSVRSTSPISERFFTKQSSHDVPLVTILTTRHLSSPALVSPDSAASIRHNVSRPLSGPSALCLNTPPSQRISPNHSKSPLNHRRIWSLHALRIMGMYHGRMQVRFHQSPHQPSLPHR